MQLRAATAFACALAGPAGVAAQQPAPAAPSFAAPNLGERGLASLAAACSPCHGTQGRPAPGSSVVPLAGRPREQIALAMAEFKGGQRPASVMHQISKGYGDGEIAALAEYFSRQQPR